RRTKDEGTNPYRRFHAHTRPFFAIHWTRSWGLGLSFFVLPFVLCPSSSARAALDPELKTPYHLRVVLEVAKHRLLTPVFIDQLRRDLRDLLQAGLGDLARVDVVREHPLLKGVRVNGLEKALEAYRQVADVKTHFLQITFAGGLYQMQARQHDG